MMTIEQLSNLPATQREALLNLQKDSGIKLSDFLDRCIPPSNLFPEVGVQDFHGMYVGVEPDGYTHT